MRVSFGCLLHDIGKPVLRAGGQAGDHSILGYAYLKKLWQDDRDILDCVRLHHAAALRAAQPADSSIAWIACIAEIFLLQLAQGLLVLRALHLIGVDLLLEPVDVAGLTGQLLLRGGKIVLRLGKLRGRLRGGCGLPSGREK